MLGIGLSRATGGSRTTGIVSLQKGIAPNGMDRLESFCQGATMPFLRYWRHFVGLPACLPRPQAPSILTFTPRMASHGWVANYRYGFSFQKGIAFTPMLGSGLSRATGGSLTTGMVSLQKGIAPSVMDRLESFCQGATMPFLPPMLGIGLSRATGGSLTTGMVFLQKRKEQTLLLTLTLRLWIGRYVASHGWVANHRQDFLLKGCIRIEGFEIKTLVRK